MAGKFELYPFRIGEIITLKKPHPCGNHVWTVERVGQEIGIRCRQCGHLLSLPRRTLEKSIKAIHNDGNEKSKNTKPISENGPGNKTNIINITEKAIMPIKQIKTNQNKSDKSS